MIAVINFNWKEEKKVEVNQAIKARRSYRSFANIEVTEDLVEDLAAAASLAPSCYNNQPWRYVFVSGNQLETLHTALADGNEWAKKASLIIAIFSKSEEDCIVDGREYYLFDVGLSVQNLMLRATELGLVTHLMAGYDADQVKEILNIPQEMELISLMAVGGKADQVDPDLSPEQKKTEKNRPERFPVEKFIYYEQVSE